MTATKTTKATPGPGQRLLAGVEYAGNLLPHPFWLFWILAAVLALVSLAMSAGGLTTTLPDGETMPIRSLISADGFRFAITESIPNFMTFPPLGPALVCLMGLALADRVGLVESAIRAMVSRVSARFVTPVLAFTCSVAHVGGDGAYIILIPLGGYIFRAVGRSAILGVVVALVALSGGSSASPVMVTNDVVFSGITTQAGQIVDPDFVMTPVGNIYFTVVSSLVLTAIIWLVVDRWLAARPMPDEETDPDEDGGLLGGGHELSRALGAAERRGLRNAGITAVVYVAAITASMLWPTSPMRGEDGGVVDSTLVGGIPLILALFFLATGAVYGITVGRITTSAHVPELIGQGLKDVTPILVLFFAISQFLAYFEWTNVGLLIATEGASTLKDLDAPPALLFAGVLVLVSAMNLFITSGSAQWSLVGPIFVPMLMLLNVEPETTTALYRIADSCTNVLTPMSPYFAMSVAIIQQYRRSAGIGTLFAMTLPLSVAMFIGWVTLFAVWYAVGLPLGPGAPIR